MAEEINRIFSPETIREQAQKIFKRIKEGQGHFNYHEEKWDSVVDHVVATIKDNYPTLEIPFHARYVHFKAGGHDRLAQKESLLGEFDSKERARILVDLVITSVLLDAGAGPDWKYVEENSGETYSRSEGLGVASFDMFFAGKFCQDNSPKATAEGLKNISASDLKECFQVTDSNPLVGVEGRVSLLNSLGKVVAKHDDIFPGGRPGGLVDFFFKEYGTEVPADELLKTLLLGLGPIWPSRLEKSGVSLGDVWEYPPLKNEGDEWSGLVPFHKLSQWLSYSLIEPLEEAGLRITNLDHLTGLPEYRNGGLFVDGGLISLKGEKAKEQKWRPDSEVIVEWRALTICLLDLCAEKVRIKMNKTQAEFPLVKVLEGGTWWAGRRYASRERADSSPPIQIESDGTVF